MGNMETMGNLSEADQVRAIAAFWFALIDSRLRLQLMSGRLETWENEIGIPKNILELVREAIIESGTCYKHVALTLAVVLCPDPPCGKIFSQSNKKQILAHMLEMVKA
jgi:hypothetical protein